MKGWTVQIELATDVDAARLDELEDALADHDAIVSRVPGVGLLVVAHHDADSMIMAAGVVEQAVLDAVGDAAPVLSLSVTPDDVHEARAGISTLPRLVSAPEVAEILGVSRQRVHQLRSSTEFPRALYELRTGPIWDVVAIEHFARTWDRRPGRRRAS